jgi:rhodanese-related sulfurtransferase
LAVAVLASYGCGDDATAPECNDKSEVLRNHLIASDMDLPDILSNSVIEANTVYGSESQYFILDIRDEDAYNMGHIPGAVHSSLSSILADAAGSGGRPIVVVCYTGQVAGHAVVALRLSGYSNAMVLKFGMSIWNADFDLWTEGCASFGVGHANWIDPPGSTENVEEHSYPSVSTSSSDGAVILAGRVNAMLQGGFRGISGYNVLDEPGGYYINNYWMEGDVELYGNIAGASRIFPMSLKNGEIADCDPDAAVVTYCWTGQTSSMITAYLTILGYDAVSLKFGVNGMIHDELTTNKWAGSFDYLYEATDP